MPTIQAPHLNTHLLHALQPGPLSSDYSGATRKSKASKVVAPWRIIWGLQLRALVSGLIEGRFGLDFPDFETTFWGNSHCSCPEPVAARQS